MQLTEKENEQNTLGATECIPTRPVPLPTSRPALKATEKAIGQIVPIFDSRVGNTSLECPQHGVDVREFVSKNGWEYIKCPGTNCMIFCAKANILPYMSTLWKYAKGEMLDLWDRFACECGERPVNKDGHFPN